MKTKLMIFNPCTSVDFMPDFKIDVQDIELVEEIRLLGQIITTDMKLKWKANTEFIVKRGYKKFWVIRRLKVLGANEDELHVHQTDKMPFGTCCTCMEWGHHSGGH